jgi:hypothetical protein
MDRPELIVMLELTGLEAESRRGPEQAWYDMLPSLQNSPVKGFCLELLSPWEIPQPWKNEFLKNFVQRTHDLLGPPMISIRRFVTWLEHLNVGKLQDLVLYRPPVPTVDPYSVWDWSWTLRHLAVCSNEFKCPVTMLNCEAYGEGRDLADLKNVDPKQLASVIKRASGPHPATYARPCDLDDWQRAIVGVAQYPTIDFLRNKTEVPEGYTPPFDPKLVFWYISEGKEGITLKQFQDINWTEMSMGLGGTAIKRWPETAVILTDFEGTLPVLEALAG